MKSRVLVIGTQSKSATKLKIKMEAETVGRRREGEKRRMMVDDLA